MPMLWRLFPNHPNLLPSYFDDPTKHVENYKDKDWVSKPKYGREGEGVLFSKDFTSYESFV